MTSRVSSQTGFLNSLNIQLRVIHALVMREIITRYGRHNLGFAWLFLEPMLFTVGVATLWSFFKGGHGSDLPIVPFAVIGYSTVLLWRNSAGRVGHAIEANAGLLYHRNVKVIDVFLARIILEVAGATISFMVLSIFFIMIGMMKLPSDFLMMAFGWTLLIWFSVALAFVIGSLFEMSDVIDRLWHAVTYLLFPLSGAAFFVYWLPTQAQDLILYVPMVHFSEMIKHGYYGSLVPTYEDVSYMIKCNLVLSFIGLFLLRHISKKVEVSA